MSKYTTHDDYIAQAPELLRSSLLDLRAQLRQALPDADEVISYNMPGFNIGKATIAGYAAFSKQCGIYVHPDAIAALAQEIAAAGLRATKTGITFTPARPLPPELIAKLAAASRKALTQASGLDKGGSAANRGS
jgi:uncharacterized protein YdhG (YjbR/CyaY superfamily)